jgi:hypothetical protein
MARNDVLMDFIKVGGADRHVPMGSGEKNQHK